MNVIVELSSRNPRPSNFGACVTNVKVEKSKENGKADPCLSITDYYALLHLHAPTSDVRALVVHCDRGRKTCLGFQVPHGDCDRKSDKDEIG